MDIYSILNKKNQFLPNINDWNSIHFQLANQNVQLILARGSFPDDTCQQQPHTRYRLPEDKRYKKAYKSKLGTNLK